MVISLVSQLSDIHYYYCCFDCAVGEKWELHCQEYVDTFASKRCGTAAHYHTSAPYRDRKRTRNLKSGHYTAQGYRGLERVPFPIL